MTQPTTPPPNTINHDTAARLLKLAPAELTKLVDQGAIPRVAKDAYLLPALVQGYIDHLRAEQQRITQRPTQDEIAEHLDLSTRRIRELASEWGIDSKSISLADWRIRYLRKLREEAAGRATAGDLDLATERARLAAAQADKVEMQNAQSREELAPVVYLTEVLAKAGARAAAILEAIPGQVRRRLPSLPATEIQAIQQEIAKARNLCAAVSLADLDAGDESSIPASEPESETAQDEK